MRAIAAREANQLFVEAEDLEDVGEVVQLAAGGWRRAADEVENLAVLYAVIGETLDPAFVVEVHRDDALVHNLLRHEGGLLAALGNIIEDLAAHGGDCRWRAESDENLPRGGGERYLFEGAVGEHVATLIGLRKAAAERCAERQEDRQTPECARATARMRAGNSHATVSKPPCWRRRALTYPAP